MAGTIAKLEKRLTQVEKEIANLRKLYNAGDIQ